MRLDAATADRAVVLGFTLDQVNQLQESQAPEILAILDKGMPDIVTRMSVEEVVPMVEGN